MPKKESTCWSFYCSEEAHPISSSACPPPQLLTAVTRRQINHDQSPVEQSTLIWSLSPARSYWGWHIVLLNLDTGWLIRPVRGQGAAAVRRVFVWWSAMGEWLHARIMRLYLKWLPGSGQDFSHKRDHDPDPGNAMMSLVNSDDSRLQRLREKEKRRQFWKTACIIGGNKIWKFYCFVVEKPVQIVTMIGAQMRGGRTHMQVFP